MKAKSSRGQATRQRIIEAAAKLMQTNGVNGTSVDDVLAASGTGKSQFYHYFVSKEALVRELVGFHLAAMPAAQEALLAGLGTWEGLEAWLGQIKADHAAGLYDSGCPIGNLASELATQSEDLRLHLQEVFDHWEQRLAQGLGRLKEEGQLRADLDPEATASFVVSALEGALLLAKTQKSARPLEVAVEQVKVHLRPLAPQPSAPRQAATAERPAVAPRKRPLLTFCP